MVRLCRPFVISILFAAALAGCGTETIVRTVTAKSTSAAAARPEQAASRTTHQTSSRTPAKAPTGSSPRSAKVGDTLRLEGDDGLTMNVTVDAVLDPLPVGAYDQADPGQRFIGIQITLRNVGSVPYSDSPSNGATLLSNADEQATGETVSGGPCGNEFGSSAKLAPGDVQQGCIAFELPANESASTFQFTLNSGFANQTGQWSLVGADSPTVSSSAPQATTTTTAPAALVATAGLGPIAVLHAYWNDIQSHQFAAAFIYLAPGATTQSEDQFVAGEQQAGIQAARFSGRVVSTAGGDATVEVSSLITRDQQFGCRSWSGSYELRASGGQWQIEKASITPRACG